MRDEPIRGRGMRAWVAPEVGGPEAVAPGGDPDVLLTRPDCTLLKLQRKVMVGRVVTAGGTLYVKRHNVFAWRVALAALVHASPADRAWRAAQALRARGFAVPDVVAAIEFRTCGLLRRSFVVTREVPDAVTADRRWAQILGLPPGGVRARARQTLARRLGELFRRLHEARVYHGDLKDVNLLVRGSHEAPSCVLLDLECVRLGQVPRRRRVKNLMQLERTLGRRASATDRMRFLAAYLGSDARPLARARWARAVLRAAAAKDRAHLPDPSPGGSSISCIVVCQDEEQQIDACLESVAWCDELIVVDGGSRDRTVERARRFTERVLTNPWPGYRAQKQFALDRAGCAWVLNVDADERVPHELADEIRAAVRVAPRVVDGFAVPRLVPYLGRWWYRGGWYPRPVLRLLRRRAARWGGADPHERAIVSGRVLRLTNPIIHYSYRDVADHLRAVDTLTAVTVSQIESPRSTGVGRLVLEPAWRFVRAYVLRAAAVEGVPGLFLAATDAFYTFLRWARVWERERGRRRPAC